MRSLLALLFFSAPLFSAELSDEELLKYVKDRTTALEKFTPQPVEMSVRSSTLCGVDVPVSGANSPHGASKAVTYGSPGAALAYFDPLGKFPEGSVVLKEKLGTYLPELPQLFTGMVKREKGYNPDCGDWEFFVADGAGAKVEKRGRLESCASCHEAFDRGDFITRTMAAGPVQISGGRLILHASTAEEHGVKLIYEKQEAKNTLGFWTEAGDWASWHFNVDTPGRYAIHLWQGCGPGSGGSEVEVRCAGQSVRFNVEDTGHFQNFKERAIGELHFDKAGPQFLEVHALSKPGMAVMDLPRIVLQPVAGP